MYIDLIRQAIHKVEQKYFRLEVTYGNNFIVRERVFCYELYHQMRILLEGRTDLTLNGEPDKRFHDEIHKPDWANPDFILHKPGSWFYNTVVCEVKGTLNPKDPRGVIKDLKTLLVYVEQYQYKSGVFIIYNHSLEELKGFLKKHKEKIYHSSACDKIYLIASPFAARVELPLSLADAINL